MMRAVIEAYKRDVDRALPRENLKLSPEERVRGMMELLKAAGEFRRAARSPSSWYPGQGVSEVSLPTRRRVVPVSKWSFHLCPP